MAYSPELVQLKLAKRWRAARKLKMTTFETTRIDSYHLPE